jgi:hypothetical protein
MTSKPELRKAAAGSLRIGLAISPIWIRRVLVGSAITSWPARAATSASVGRPHDQHRLAGLQPRSPQQREPVGLGGKGSVNDPGTGSAQQLTGVL